MNEERLEQIIENVYRRNIINCACGNNTSESDNEILELLDEINRLKDELYSTNQVVNELLDIKTRIDKAIPKLKELNIKLKDILKIGIDIKEISDIENILTGGDER